VSAEDDLRFAVRRSLGEAGISQAFVAEQLGLSTKHLSQMMTGRSAMSVKWAEKILELAGRKLVVGVAKRDPDGG
jgi:transcriptional regulator with XRE-family HTH domain